MPDPSWSIEFLFFLLWIQCGQESGFLPVTPQTSLNTRVLYLVRNWERSFPPSNLGGPSSTSRERVYGRKNLLLQLEGVWDGLPFLNLLEELFLGIWQHRRRGDMHFQSQDLIANIKAPLS